MAAQPMYVTALFATLEILTEVMTLIQLFQFTY